MSLGSYGSERLELPWETTMSPVAGEGNRARVASGLIFKTSQVSSFLHHLRWLSPSTPGRGRAHPVAVEINATGPQSQRRG